MPMNPRLLRPIAARVTGVPRQIAGLGGWWDATDASSYTLDTGVTEWRDKSGLGQAFTQGAGASQPTINATGLGGKPALSFDGSNDWMDLGSQTIGGNDLLAEAANEYSIFFVCKNVGGNTLFAKAGNNGNLRTVQIVEATSGVLTTVIRGTTQNQASETFPRDETLLLSLAWDGTDMAWRSQNNTGTASVGVAAVESQNITLGARTAGSPAFFFNGLVGEVIFYNRVLAAGEQATLFAYLNDKWGLSLT